MNFSFQNKNAGENFLGLRTPGGGFGIRNPSEHWRNYNNDDLISSI